MNKNYKYFLGIYYRGIDLIALNLSFFIAVFIRFGNEPSFSFFENNYVTLLLFINLSWVVISNWQQLYNIYNYSSKRRYIFRVAIIVLVHFLLTIGINGLIKTFYSRLFLFYTYVGFGLFMSLGRLASNAGYRSYVKKKWRKYYVVLIGEGFSLRDVTHFLNEDSIGEEFQKVEVLTSTDEVIDKLELLRKNAPISEIYINLSQTDKALIDQLAHYCDNNFVRLRLIMDWQRISSKQITAKKYNETTVFNIPLSPLDDPYNTLLKRTFDIVFSIFMLLFVFSWLFVIVAILIKFTSKGPIFFRQKRTGIGNKEFYCLKFRSMYINKDADQQQAIQNDVRITKLGAFLRWTSIDELPQFFNVLKGDMSVVGPRPHMLKHTEEYSKQIGNFMNRHAIKPGITGLAQVKGFRGEIDTPFLLHNRVRLDRFYVNNWSLYLDLKIVALTAVGMFKKHR